MHLRVLVRCAIVSLLTMGTLGVAEPAGPSRGRAHRAARAVLPATYLFAFSSIESFQQGAKYIIFSARKMREFYWRSPSFFLSYRTLARPRAVLTENRPSRTVFAIMRSPYTNQEGRLMNDSKTAAKLRAQLKRFWGNSYPTFQSPRPPSSATCSTDIRVRAY